MELTQAEKDSIMAEALAEHDAYVEALNAELDNPDAAVQDRSASKPSFGEMAAAVAIGTAIGNRL